MCKPDLVREAQRAKGTYSPEVCGVSEGIDTLRQLRHERLPVLLRRWAEVSLSPPVDAAHIQRYFADVKNVFGAIDELVTIVTSGVSVKAAPRGSSLGRDPQYDNHRSAAEHLPVI